MAEGERSSFEIRAPVPFDIEDDVEKHSVARDRSERLRDRRARRRFLIETVLICLLLLFALFGILIWWRRDGRDGSVISKELVDLGELGKRLHSVSDAEWLSQKTAIAIFFCALEHTTCRAVTPLLSRVFIHHSLREKGVEVVFVSLDEDKESFNSYSANMPWKALSFNERGVKNELISAFRITEVPSIALLDNTGARMSPHAVHDLVASNPGIQTYPEVFELFLPLLKRHSVIEHLKRFSIMDHDGKHVALDDLKHGVLGIYFTGMWCRYCLEFTPKLNLSYNKDLKEKGLEVLFVSLDENPIKASEYFDMQPWLALNFSSPGFFPAAWLFKRDLEIQGIPTLVLVDPVKDQVISKHGRGMVRNDPEGLRFPWTTILDLTDERVLRSILENEIPVVIAFCEEVDESGQRAARDVLAKDNQQCMDEATERGEAMDEADFRFMIVTKINLESNALRKSMSLPVLPLNGQVGHELGQRSCKLVLLDHTHNEFYEGATSDLSMIAALGKLVQGFLDGSLAPKQLSRR